MKSEKRSLGMIGIGQFAEFFIPHLKPYFSKIVIASKNDKSAIAKRLDVAHGNIKDSSSQDFVILAMPISETEKVLMEIKDSVKPGSVIMDICSVKIYPLTLMKKILPENINIIGSHPLFGPQSGKNGIKGLDIVICPIKAGADIVEQTISIFKEMGLNIIKTTPEIHDKIMAETQALTHFFTKGVLKTLNTETFAFSTLSSRKLFSIINDIKDDTNILFRDIETLNPYAKDVRTELINNLIKINKELLKNHPNNTN